MASKDRITFVTYANICDQKDDEIHVLAKNIELKVNESKLNIKNISEIVSEKNFKVLKTKCKITTYDNDTYIVKGSFNYLKDKIFDMVQIGDLLTEQEEDVQVKENSAPIGFKLKTNTNKNVKEKLSKNLQLQRRNRKIK